MATLLSIIALLVAIALGYAIALDPGKPFAGWSGSARFGLFLVVTASAGLLFRDVVSLVYPFLQGVSSPDALLSFLGGLVILAAIVWVYMLTKPNLSALSAQAARLTSRPGGPPRPQ
jgi:hypothetical protein